jgi:hypothetical protein
MMHVLSEGNPVVDKIRRDFPRGERWVVDPSSTECPQCSYPARLRGVIMIGGVDYWAEICIRCARVYRVGDGIPPKDAPRFGEVEP